MHKNNQLVTKIHCYRHPFNLKDRPWKSKTRWVGASKRLENK